MQPHTWVALVTLLALVVYLAFGINVGRTRYKVGIFAPAMTGDPRLERAIRVQANTLEWLPVFLVAMWLFAIYWNDLVAAAIGVVWIIGRILFAVGYMADPAKRAPGFLIQALATLVLLLGALGRVIYVAAVLHA
jgi:glutathione S-transferase